MAAITLAEIQAKLGLDTSAVRKDVGGIPNLFKGLGGKIIAAAGFAVVVDKIISIAGSAVTAAAQIETGMAKIGTLAGESLRSSTHHDRFGGAS